MREGKIEFEVPAGDIKKSAPVFYNPVMELPRDISIAVYKQYAQPGWTFLDALAASGIRALRVAKEVGLPVTAVDLNPTALSYMEKNAKRNKIDPEIIRADANAIMAQRVFDIVDIDPFGTPAPFIDMAVRSAKKLLSITATDTAVLCGTYPSTCLRRYMARPQRTDFLHEFGVRLLTGYAIRMAARFDIQLLPVFCHAAYHYYRVYFEVDGGAGKTDRCLKEVKTITWSPTRMGRTKNTDETTLGPIWIGRLWKKGLANKVRDEIGNGEYGTRNSALKMLELIADEEDLPPLYYDLHMICKLIGKPCPKFGCVQGKLTDKGIKNSRTHFCRTGLRAECSLEELKAVLGEC